MSVLDLGPGVLSVDEKHSTKKIAIGMINPIAIFR
jgi:hypothetical protein